MRTIRLFILMIGAALLFLAISMFIRISINISTHADPDPSISFAEQLGQPVRLTIVAPSEDQTAMRALIKARDTGNLISDTDPQSDLTQADAVLYLLDGWSDIETAPWQKELSSDYARLEENDADTLATSITTVSGARPLQLTFYNLQHDERWGLDCYASLFMHNVIFAEGVAYTPPDACPL